VRVIHTDNRTLRRTSAPNVVLHHTQTGGERKRGSAVLVEMCKSKHRHDDSKNDKYGWKANSMSGANADIKKWVSVKKAGQRQRDEELGDVFGKV
jgi:hypothetical protein